MRIALLALIAFFAGPAAAQGSGSCTFVYNVYAKRVESRCQGIPAAPLGSRERRALATGKVKSCVVEVIRVDAKRVKAQQPVCQ
ncbi:MAG: hypothetical protein HYS35_07990 [Betaproteobacteria bacterium]|nr:hypothetical protein [Betaproteobacteria bacterium]